MKTNKIIRFFPFFLAIILLFSCGKEDEKDYNGGIAPLDYIPYKTGNVWHYLVEPVSGDSSYTASLTVIDQITENGVELAIVKEEDNKNPGEFSLMYYQTTTGSLLMHKIAEYNSQHPDTLVFEPSTAAIWMEIPFVKDETWDVFSFEGDPSTIPLVGSGLNLDSSFADLNIKLFLTGKTVGEETVAAAGEQFKPFKVDLNFVAEIPFGGATIQFPGKLGSFWVEPYVGIVQIKFYDMSGDVREVRTLTSYTLN